MLSVKKVRLKPTAGNYIILIGDFLYLPYYSLLMLNTWILINGAFT